MLRVDGAKDLYQYYDGAENCTYRSTAGSVAAAATTTAAAAAAMATATQGRTESTAASLTIITV
jgi:hypothetical protein